jgi:8-oxo-dGTP pyrophosphatase MutT (NUDIX family)
MIRPWQKLDSTILHDYRIFRARQDRSRSPRTGKDHTFYVLEAADWVNVIPLTPEGKVVMVHQYRHGTETVTLEVPGGIVDEEDGDPGVSAARELREETGYEAAAVISIGRVAPNPAFLNNTCHSYLALDARRVTTPAFDGAEDIAVEEVALADIPGLIQDGVITHALTIAAFYHLERYQEARAAAGEPAGSS